MLFLKTFFLSSSTWIKTKELSNHVCIFQMKNCCVEIVPQDDNHVICYDCNLLQNIIKGIA